MEQSKITSISILSVSVVGAVSFVSGRISPYKNAILADAYATVLMAMGIEKPKEFLFPKSMLI